MAGPGLPTNLAARFGSGLTTTNHHANHDSAHSIVNIFDTGNTATSGYVPVGNGTVFVSRALLSTDMPAVVVNTRTASYTLVLADAGKLVEMNVASANTLTVPPNSSVAFPVGTVIPIRQYGAGVTTVTAGTGVAIRCRGVASSTAIPLAGAYAEGTLTKRATDEWLLSGDVTAT